MGAVRQVARTVGAVGAAYKAVKATIKIEGKPVLERAAPASVSIAGFEFFKRDENLERSYLGGLIKRGRSAYAKRYLASQGIQ